MATMNPRAKAALMNAMALQRQGARPAAMPAMPNSMPPAMKKGGKVKKMAKGGSASSRADGIAERGKTKGCIC